MKIASLFPCLVCFLMLNNIHARPPDGLDSIMLHHGLIGFSLVAVYEGNIVMSEHRGLARLSHEKKTDRNTLYRFASVSKAITAMAFMMLEQEGLVDLDEDISNIMGYAIQNPHHPEVPVTPRMLLSHTSGLLDGSSYMPFLLNETYENPGAPSIRELICSEGAHYGEDLWHHALPGTYFSYSNLGYGLLGTIIETVSGQRFDLFVKGRILQPLGIRGGFNVRDIENPGDLAVLYRKTDGAWQPQADHFPGGMLSAIDFSVYRPGTNALLFGPQGGLRIAAEDLAKIMILLVSRGTYDDIGILKPETVQKMQEVQWHYDGSNGDNYRKLFNCWGLGLWLTTLQPGADMVVPGFRMRGHAGQAYGLLSGMYFHNDPDFGIIFALNGKAGAFSPGQRSALYLEEEVLIDFLFHQAIAPLLDD